MFGATIGIAENFFPNAVKEVKKSNEGKVTLVPKWLGFTGVSYTVEGFLNKPHVDPMDHQAGGMVVWMLHQQGDFSMESYPTFFLDDGLRASFKPQHGDLLWLKTKQVTHGTIQGQGRRLAPLMGIGLYSHPRDVQYHEEAIQASYNLVDTLVVKTELKRRDVMKWKHGAADYDETRQAAMKKKQAGKQGTKQAGKKAAKKKMPRK